MVARMRRCAQHDTFMIVSHSVTRPCCFFYDLRLKTTLMITTTAANRMRMSSNGTITQSGASESDAIADRPKIVIMSIKSEAIARIKRCVAVGETLSGCSESFSALI